MHIFSFNKKLRLDTGFTLIELLVVIAIIGVLSSITLASLTSAKAKSRDTKRTLSIKQLQTALELYYNDNNQYPSSGDVVFPGILTAALASSTPQYISQIPTTPAGSASPYRYYTNSLSPAPFYAIYMPYETKTACYVCGGPTNMCGPGMDYWGVGVTTCR